MTYTHSTIEKKWQAIWDKNNLYRTDDKSKKEKFYVLDMFPYPSGDGLHVGHTKGYIATDIIARRNMMAGKNVLHPMGWDAFGLPAENYALKNKVHPSVAVSKNINRFKEQLSKLGFTYDWSREVNTTDPEYYRWTQWIFLQLFKKGLAYESFAPINWCPSCKTGLANEDVENGRCERCGTLVEKKPMRQWMLKITDYAEQLLDGLKELNWPESTKEAQRQWIGKSEGVEIDFQVSDSKDSITVFTTRPDTLYGVTYVVVAPEYPLLSQWLEKITNREEVERYIEAVKNKPEMERTAENQEKTGVKLEGIEVTHPITNKPLPIYVADYVLGDYGTGAVMAVPAHDRRDYQFAEKYELPIIPVIMPVVVDTKNPPRSDKKTVERNNVHVLVRDPKTNKFLLLRWKKFPWRNFVVGGVEDGEDIIEAAKREVREETGYTDIRFVRQLGGQVQGNYFAAHKDENRIANTTALYFELESDKQEEVSEEEKEKHEPEWVELKDMNYENMVCAELDIWKERLEKESIYTGSGILYNCEKLSGQDSEKSIDKIISLANGRKTVRYKLRDWVFSRQRYWGEPIPIVHCEKCGVVAVPEKDLPVRLPDVESYEPTGTGESPLAGISDWVNTTCPGCKGPAKRETNTMPQWAGSSWYYLRYTDPHNEKEILDKKKGKYWLPVDMYIGGAEHSTRHLIYARFWHKFLYDIKVVTHSEPFQTYSNLGLIMGEDGRKMSKRWGNVVNPDEMVEKYGADALRVYEMFIGPFTQTAAFKISGVAGAESFLRRVWQLQEKISDTANEAPVLSLTHKTIKKVGEDIDNLRFNTAVSSLMILTNAYSDQENISNEMYETLLQLLAPFAPHMSEELWHRNNRNEDESIFNAEWPTYNPKLLQDETVTLAIQINGKVRDTISIGADASEDVIKEEALSREKVKPWLEGKEIDKVVVVKGRIINIVVK